MISLDSENACQPIVKVLGVPYDFGVRSETSQATDSAHAPSAIRKAYRSLLGGYNIPQHFEDLGDITTVTDIDSLLECVKTRIVEIVRSKAISAVLGGAHTLSLGSLRGLSSSGLDYSLVYFDAHPDIMPRAEIDYGSTIYHAIEEGVLNPRRIVYVGIRQIEDEEWQLIHQHDILVISPTDFVTCGIDKIWSRMMERVPPPYYLSIDLDCLDPNFAPGVTTPYPFGILPRELLMLASLVCQESLLGFEIVELCPARDMFDQTTMMAAILLHNLSDVVCRDVNIRAAQPD